MGAEGLEPKTQHMEKQGGNTVNAALSESAGAQAGAIDSGSDSQGQLLKEALDDLQRAWKSLGTLESLSDDQAEVKAAGRARGFIDRAFRELE